MKKDYRDKIVQKSSEIEIGIFNDSSDFIITHKRLGNRIVVNEKTIQILSLVDGKTSLNNIVSKYNSQNPKSKLTEEIAESIFYEKLAKFGIILDENISLKKKEVASYLSLSFTLVNKKTLSFFTKILSPIFLFKYFYLILFSCLTFVTVVLLLNYKLLTNNILEMSFNSWLFYIIISGVVIFLHEFGHATACKKLGAEPSSIGFGFYLLSPVMFADVSDVWRLKKKERIYVNFAGLYVELIIAFFLSVIYIFTEEISLLILCLIIVMSFFINLNPLLRYDGYWILSDITDTPNLRRVSLDKLRSFIAFLTRKKDFSLSKKNIFLVIYASLSVIFIVFFLGFIIFNDPNSILSFPNDIITLIKDITSKKKELNLANISNLILPFLFYFIVFRFFINYFRSKIPKP